jgi:uncharacterized protein (TIGR00299 family) protein
MVLGALVDLGLTLETLRAELGKLPVGGYRLEARKVNRSGLVATKVDVIVEESPSHGHSHHGHHHRGVREILGMLERSSLPDAVKERSARIFKRLAEAEGAVHGISPEEVHFHEVGAIDSIVDTVGSVVGLNLLGAGRFTSSPLNLGGGTVTMSHGTFPVPAPATAALVRGVPVYSEGDRELLTPTGALLLTEYVGHYGPLPPMRPGAVGHGAGGHDTPGRPNVLRLIVGEEEGAAASGRVFVVETEVDDATGQLLGVVSEHLFAAGALDCFLTPIQMKKGRPGTLITVLVEPAQREAAEEILFRETTTLGVRRTEWERTILDRRWVSVPTPYGEIRVKVGERGGKVYNVQPEFEDCRGAAERTGAALKEVWAAALASYGRNNEAP